MNPETKTREPGEALGVLAGEAYEHMPVPDLKCSRHSVFGKAPNST